jgi:Acetyltransferase (GNAT) family
MAVAPDHRRHGVATEMLARCERIARLWGQTSVWLHVEIQNEGAERLYRGLGYKQVPWLGSSALPWNGKKRQVLLVKELRPLPKKRTNLYLELDSSNGSGGNSTDTDSNVAGEIKTGVFVWNVKEGEGEGGGDENGHGGGEDDSGRNSF